MNQKHISCGIIALLIFVLVQVTLSVQANRTKVQREAGSEEQKESDAMAQLNRERSQLAELKRQSADLIEFLRVWQPQFDIINTAQTAEVNFSMMVRDSGLVNLAQSYRTEALKGNPSIPSVLQATLLFEDEYVRLLNWLGKMEKSLPTMRTRQVHISKGSRASDIRMEVVMEQPLIAK